MHGNKFKHLAGLSYAGLAGSSAAFLLILAAMLFAPAASQPEALATDDNSAISTYAATPTVGISLPTSIDFADVLPTLSGAATTATANLTVTTTDSAGYRLYLYSSDGDNSLKPKNPSLANISTINATAGDVGLTLSSLEPNTWGYNIGTEAPTDSTTYSAVPANNSTPIQTKDTSDTNSANDTYTLSFGAKVDSTIASGAYSNALTVAVVAEPRAITYIQDFTLSDCQSRASDADFTVADRRDDNEYTVRYINGACWMTQNLRLSGGRDLTSADSNVTQDWSFPTTQLADNSNSFIEPQTTISSNASYGGYYNYCAASAGTVCNDTTEQDATQDICPKGWRLPTYNEQSGITSYTSAFSPVLSGYYINGALGTGSGGFWWSATAFSNGSQYFLYYNNGSSYTDSILKHLGFSVRCIRSNPGTLTINFDGNGSTGGSTASQQIAAGNTAPLNANGFTRTEYAFTGWNTAADGSGTSYADGADYTVTPATGDATVTLYAQWEQIPTTMQDITVAQCQIFASDAPLTLPDTRDNNSYAVRYINGACWMTQNLRLSGGRTLTSADSNVASSWSFPSTPLADSNYSYTDPQVTISSNTSYGGYYNFCAASAGTNCQTSSTVNTTYDICPKGWRLPTLNEMDGITSSVSAFSPVLSGDYFYGSLGLAGSQGFWWSATAYNSSLQYYLYYHDSNLKTNFLYKHYGYSVRCIRSNPGTLTINFDGNGSTGGSTASQQIAAGSTASLNDNGFTRTGYMFTGWNTATDGSGTSYADGADYTVTPATGDTAITLYAQWEELVNVGYMQDFTNAQCQAQASSRPVIATDIRDKNTYILRYINGACWMTQNLRLSGGRTLTSADSNVASSWSFPSTPLAGSSSSYTAPQVTISSNTYYGGYYNYCAASAGTVCSSSSVQNATYDICPKGWRLPTYNEQDGITGYASAFSPVDSGYYGSGLIHGTGVGGGWWSATAHYPDSYYQSILYGGSGWLGGGISEKYLGYSVRCIRSS